MEQRTDRLCPSAPLENNVLKQRLEKKMNDVCSFNNSINNIEDVIAFFEDENHKSKKEENKKALNT